jgi:hypothetical protein
MVGVAMNRLPVDIEKAKKIINSVPTEKADSYDKVTTLSAKKWRRYFDWAEQAFKDELITEVEFSELKRYLGVNFREFNRVSLEIRFAVCGMIYAAHKKVLPSPYKKETLWGKIKKLLS